MIAVCISAVGIPYFAMMATAARLFDWTTASLAALHISGVVIPNTSFVAGRNDARRCAIFSK